jgi:superfamily II DNA or RNA helicase
LTILNPTAQAYKLFPIGQSGMPDPTLNADMLAVLRYLRHDAVLQLDAIDQRRGKHLRVFDWGIAPLDSDWLVSAKVQGSRAQPYEVAISMQFDRTWMWQASCTCPRHQTSAGSEAQAVSCKHIAAVMLHDSQATPDDTAPASDKLQQWLKELRAASPEALQQSAKQALRQRPSNELRLYLQLHLEPVASQTSASSVYFDAYVRPLLAALDEQRLHVQAELSPFRILAEHASVLAADDIVALKELAEFEPQLIQTRHMYPLRGARGLAALEDALRWQRLVVTGRMGELAQLADPARLQLEWVANDAGKQRLQPVLFAHADTESPARRLRSAKLLSTEPLSAFDLDANCLMRVLLPSTPAKLNYALNFPALHPQHASEQWQQLQLHFGKGLPEPRQFNAQSLRAQLTPVLRLSLSADKEALLQRRLKRRIGYARQLVEISSPRLEAPLVVPLSQYVRGVERLQDDALLQIEVDLSAVQRWTAQAQALGLERQGQRTVSGVQDHADWLVNPDYDEGTLSEFCFVGVPHLKRQGWKIEYSQGFPLKLIEQPLEFIADISDADSTGYFDLALGVEVNGRKLSLLPIIESGIAQGRYEKLPDNPDAIVALHLPDGPVPITVSRLKFILGLYQDASLQARMPRMRAGILNELDQEFGSELRWHGEANLRPLAERLNDALSPDGLPDAQSPKGLTATLRNYQVYGLRWLKFLSRAELAGILADDMGLGKTVQVIAHILQEQEDHSGVMPPVLIVAPTSVIPNWRAELARFAPKVKVLNLTGHKRSQQLAQIAPGQVLLSSYALLGRDLAKLLPHDYHLLVLDEAQLVKNPSTIAAKAARQLRARHRLCMTGTPLENHLGELWAQFDFLMPGFLGSKNLFQKNIRTPIEKRRDQDSLTRLRQRIAPFLLRRTKDQVVAELPPKSVIVKRIQLEGKQRDMYETLRLKLKAQIGAQMQERGAQFSRINLLDALLKLRQVCCDPRLLPSESAATGVGSAKLDQLSDMLQSLVHEGRRVLVFSQFTSMLSLIEAELQRRKLRYLLLTGASEDRETPVRQFQNREVPIFLISLRAGGVGLNLTAADTVVHFDPWWNPAVEEQATDRAYRIGQDKPVFVYRLIAADTIEERIEEMKSKKKELADALLDDAAVSNFSVDELFNLLAD